MDGRRGGKCLVFRGYLYHKRSEYNGTTYWKCVERKRCNARAQTENRSLRIIRSSAHSHDPCEECVQSRGMESTFKWRHRGRIPRPSEARLLLRGGGVGREEMRWRVRSLGCSVVPIIYVVILSSLGSH
ncbi:hypothetical protein C0J52_09983 [Blattella germanica]|nr:hypothetical protein C0J52_09983 [Blattella germanica]